LIPSAGDWVPSTEPCGNKCARITESRNCRMVRTSEDRCFLSCHGRQTAFDRRGPERGRRICPAAGHRGPQTRLPCDAPQAGILHRGRELQYSLSRGTRVLVRGQCEMARGSSRSNRRPNRGRLRLLGLARRRPRTYSGVCGCGNLASRGLPALSLLQDFESQPNRPTEVTVQDAWQRLHVSSGETN
jgi:hypothetical protein